MGHNPQIDLSAPACMASIGLMSERRIQVCTRPGPVFRFDDEAEKPVATATMGAPSSSDGPLKMT